LAATRLQVQLLRQKHSQWCWAAVTASVVTFFTGKFIEQCAVVNRVLGTRSCCWAGSFLWCDVPHRTYEALDAFSRLARWTRAPAALDVIQSEIDANRPIGVGINWSGNTTSHVVLIVGYEGDMLTVADPSWASGDQHEVGYDEMRLQYNRTGRWVRTYYTRL